MLKFLVWLCPNFADVVKNSLKLIKMAYFGFANPCESTNTFQDLSRVQQTCHGWKANTYVSGRGTFIFMGVALAQN